MTMTNRTAKLRERVAKSALDSPEEHAIAVAMLAKTPEGNLDRIADDIMSAWSGGIEAEFRIGHLLAEAAELTDPLMRTVGPDGRVKGSPFGDWFRAQGFPFTIRTAHRLRTAAEREPEVRAYIAAHTGRDMGVNTAIARLSAPPKPIAIDVGPTAPVDPAYRALRAAAEAVGGVGESNAFKHMHIDDFVSAKGLIQSIVDAYTEVQNSYRAVAS
jgi:hypothetical protein